MDGNKLKFGFRDLLAAPFYVVGILLIFFACYIGGDFIVGKLSELINDLKPK